MDNDKTPYIIGGCAALFVCLLCLATATFILYKQLLANTYVRTEAVIVDHYYRYDTDDSEGHYYDIVEYEVDGKTYTKVALNGGTYLREPNNFGESKTVYYNPDNPDDVLYKTSTQVILIVITYAVGVGCAVITAVVFTNLRRKSRK